MSHLRRFRVPPRLFYPAVLLVALVGSGQAATGWLNWWPPFAYLAVACVEFGAVVLSTHADERRQLGERAVWARLLSAGVAAGAVAVNWFGHPDNKMQAGFFAGMSALGYLVWLDDSAARRRDALRRAGMLPPTPPVYGLVRWLRHPWLTRRARQLALRDPALGLYGSLSAAAAAVRSERRQAAIATELRTMIAAAAGPTMATVAVNTFDMDEIARRLAAGADYDGLAARLAAQLTPAALTPKVSDPGHVTGSVQVSNPGQVSQPGHVAELSQMDQSELSQPGTVELSNSGRSAGADVLDGDLFELAASLADRPHFPLPREVADQARPTDGHRDSLSLADLFPGPTVAQATTVSEDPTNGHRNGAHVAAIPPADLALTEPSERAADDAHEDTTAALTETPEVSGDPAHEGAHSGAHKATSPALTLAPTPAVDGAHGEQPDTATSDTEVSTERAAKKLPANERKVARALARTPDATAAEIARRTGIPASTVRRLIAKLRAHDSTKQAAS